MRALGDTGTGQERPPPQAWSPPEIGTTLGAYICAVIMGIINIGSICQLIGESS